MLVFIIFEVVAQAYLVVTLYSIKNKLLSFINLKFLKLKAILVSILVFVICFVLFLYIFTSAFKENFSTIEYFAFSLILAGGLGNLIDRIYYGFVVDFIDISFNPYIFNLADSYVTIGILIYVLKSLILFKNESN